MKKFRKSAVTAVKISSAAFFALFCLASTDSVKAAVESALTRCLTVVVPSLYAMMIVSGFLVRSGIIEKLSAPLSKAGRFFFGMDGCIFPIFLFSMFAGYPVGAKMLSTAAEKGDITQKQANLLSGICFGAGPAFIFGCISSQLYGSSAAGKLILFSTISANIVLALLLSLKLKSEKMPDKRCANLRLTSDVLMDSILCGGRSMADICIMITAFSVFTAFLADTGAVSAAAELISAVASISPQSVCGLLCCFIDVTAADSLPQNDYSILPAICGLSSFGGVCVIMQISAVTAGKIRILPVVVLRIAAAVISGIICRFAMPFFLAEEAVQAAEINVSAHQAASPVPSVLLIIMTIILFSEYDKASGVS